MSNPVSFMTKPSASTLIISKPPPIKARTYEQEERWDKALEAYRQAEAIDNKDPFIRALAENAMRMLMIQKDKMKQKELSVAIKKVAERYRQNRFDPVPVDDPWTSRPTRVAFFDISESGGLSQRAGFAGLLKDHLARQMGASGRGTGRRQSDCRRGD